MAPKDAAVAVDVSSAATADAAAAAAPASEATIVFGKGWGQGVLEDARNR